MRTTFNILITVFAIAASILLAANIAFANTGEGTEVPIGASYVFEGNTYSVDSIRLEGVDVKSIKETYSVEREKEIEIMLSGNTEDDCRFNISFQTSTADASKAPLVLDKPLEVYSQDAGTWGGILGYGFAMEDTKRGNIANGTKKVRLRAGYGEVSVYSYLYPNEEAYYPFVAHLVFRKEGTLPCAVTSCDLRGDGQWMSQNALFGAEKCGRIVVPYSEAQARLSFKKEGPCDAYIDGNKAADADLPQWESTLSASNEGDTHIIELRINETVIRSYRIVCYKAQYSDMPDKVIDYLCPNSQYTNNETPANVPYGSMDRAVATLRGGNYDAAPDLYCAPVSLGNLGGYITYYYNDPITDVDTNPYGIDFIVNSNSVTGKDAFAEPGNVSVSEDGKTWYKLAGSIHYDDAVRWNQKIVYRKGENGTTTVQIGDEEEFSSAFRFPRPSIYPLYQWENAEKDRITLTSDRIVPQEDENEYGNTIPTYPAFGYADCGMRDTTNQASNPYTGLKSWGESGRVDGFDLAWAVDDEGKPVKLPNGIHYIKIATATMIDGGAIGEKSTEVNMVRRAAANEKSVGTTTAPASIEIDGQSIAGDELRPFELIDVDVEGIFDIRVNAMKNANVYINSLRSNTAFLEKADHGIVRIIVQEGRKTPLIYYFQIHQSPQSEGKAVSEVLLKSQSVDHYLKPERLRMVCFYDADTLAHQANADGEIPFPEPTLEDTETVIWHYLGFSDEEGKTYTGYSADFAAAHAGKVTLSENTEREELTDVPEIIVSFRLIGSTLAKEPIDLSQGPLSAEYQTWYATREYKVPYGSTVYDVFCKALEQAGLTAVGASANYVSTIIAPKALGGYKLSEMSNGAYSGWMYTLNGEHSDGMKDVKVEDGDEIVWHYVNDYRYEVSDWEHLGGSAFPQLGTDASQMDLWLAAEDKDPVEPASEEKPGTQQKPQASQTKPGTTAQTKSKAVKAPARPKITKVKASKKALTVKWKKVKTASGYRVQIARDKKFKKGRKTKKIRKIPGKGLRFKKLKSKKKYFVRVQAYRIVKGKTVYGKWSAVKKVKVK